MCFDGKIGGEKKDFLSKAKVALTFFLRLDHRGSEPGHAKARNPMAMAVLVFA